VSGAITVDGKPLAAGTMTLVPDGGQLGPQPCEVKDGRYTGRAFAGRHKVEVRANRKLGRKIPSETPGVLFEPEVNYLPARYNDATTLTLTVEAKPDNAADFALTSK
jgi:hypothetical protein